MGLFTALGSALGGTSLTELQAGAGPANAADRTDSFPWAHLWFLYYLAIFYALALAARAAFRRVLDREGHIRRALDAVVGGALSGVWGAALVGLPLAAYFYTVDGWPAWTGLPAPIALLPQAPSLIGYGTAFAFGWLAHRQASRLLALERRWARFAVMAVMLTSVSIYIGGTTPRFAPYLQGSPLLIFAAAYLVGAWCWVFALIGLAVRFFSDVSPARRYLSDASYWMYLMHLPVLAFFAVWLGPLQLHWTIKYSLQVAGTIVLLLVSYRYLVRPTFIGAMLNGRRYPRAAAVTVPTLKDRL
jgi:hypothetical protein